MNNEKINAAVQEVAIQFISFRGPMASLAGYVRQSLGGNAPSLAEIVHYLQKEETRKELLNWEVGLFKNTIGDWSLVSLATPPTIETMRYRLEHFPVSNTCCRWCLQDAKRLAHIDLILELDIHGNPVPRSLLHPGGCTKAWLTMRTQVARADAASTTKVSLL